LEGSFPWFPKNAKAPTAITTMTNMAIAANNVLFDFLRLTGGLLFLLGVMSGSSAAFHIRFFHNLNIKGSVKYLDIEKKR
jgi:hypothetical protein